MRDDLESIVGFCRAHRGEYECATKRDRRCGSELAIRLEAGASEAAVTPAPVRRSSWSSWLSRSWELSFPQLAAAAAAIVLVVSLSTVVGLRTLQSGKTCPGFRPENTRLAEAGLRDRVSNTAAVDFYWNQRVEFNKARWSPEMRETFDRNLAVIDQTVNESSE